MDVFGKLILSNHNLYVFICTYRFFPRLCLISADIPEAAKLLNVFDSLRTTFPCRVCTCSKFRWLSADCATNSMRDRDIAEDITSRSHAAITQYMLSGGRPRELKQLEIDSKDNSVPMCPVRTYKFNY